MNAMKKTARVNEIGGAREMVAGIIQFLKGLSRMSAIDLMSRPKTKATPVKAARVAAVHKPVRRCIAPDCRKLSTGPRFHFCCLEHREATAEQIAAWQAAYKAE